jgi:hypothetical protein
MEPNIDKTLKVTNIDPHATESTLSNLFAQHYGANFVRFVRAKQLYGYVYFESPQAAQLALTRPIRESPLRFSLPQEYLSARTLSGLSVVTFLCLF